MTMPKLNSAELKRIILASYEAERTGDVALNKSLISPDFKFTDMVVDEDGAPFIKMGGQEASELMNEAFKIKGRKFIFKTIVADEDTQKVIVEFIESYPDPNSGKEFRTPQVAIIEFNNGLIHRTRHYLDPRISYLYLAADEVEKAFTP